LQNEFRPKLRASELANQAIALKTALRAQTTGKLEKDRFQHPAGAV
jgi:hypothetical protein